MGWESFAGCRSRQELLQRSWDACRVSLLWVENTGQRGWSWETEAQLEGQAGVESWNAQRGAWIGTLKFRPWFKPIEKHEHRGC